MHSSRMRTAGSLTVSHRIGGGSAQPLPLQMQTPPDAYPPDADLRPWMQTPLRTDRQM